MIITILGGKKKIESRKERVNKKKKREKKKRERSKKLNRDILIVKYVL